MILAGHTGFAAGPDIATTLVKGGCYPMGNQFGDGGFDEKPVHEVCVDSFRLGIFEVSEFQWQAVMGADLPLKFLHGPSYPAVGVSWVDVREFISRLNMQTGLKYRLPTEAEWEYAARSGGKQQKFSGTNDEKSLPLYACSNNSCAGSPSPVGLKKPNELGIFDMSGNAWEWVHDRYDPYYYRHSPRSNPHGDPFGTNRVIRGGASDSVNGQMRTTYREYLSPDIRKDGVGFRLVLPAQ
jgi:formylglycine-generating enzyme required for sulfatase activity